MASLDAVKGAMIAAVFLSAGGALAEGVTRAVTVVTPSKQEQLDPDNPAGMTIDILPGEEFAIGSKVGFRVGAQKPGYLVLVDVDASGKVTQRYPNLYSMALPAGASEKANLLQPGRIVSIPDNFNPFAHFEYVAEAPAGKGMILALLSPKPVHVVDLPDVPQDMVGTRAAVAFLYDAAKRLRIADRDGKAPLADPNWSFAVKSYSITP